MELYVLRHGQTDENINHIINSINDHSLNEVGKQQAKKASKLINKLDIDLIIASPLQRTVETTNIVNKKGLPVIFDNRIIERDAGTLQYKPDDYMDENVWYDLFKTKIYEDSEGFKSILNRVENFISEIEKAYKNKNILLVTHGDVCKAIYKYFNKNITIDEIIKFEQKNCEVICYDLKK